MLKSFLAVALGAALVTACSSNNSNSANPFAENPDSMKGKVLEIPGSNGELGVALNQSGTLVAALDSDGEIVEITPGMKNQGVDSALPNQLDAESEQAIADAAAESELVQAALDMTAQDAEAKGLDTSNRQVYLYQSSFKGNATETSNPSNYEQKTHEMTVSGYMDFLFSFQGLELTWEYGAGKIVDVLEWGHDKLDLDGFFADRESVAPGIACVASGATHGLIGAAKGVQSLPDFVEFLAGTPINGFRMMYANTRGFFAQDQEVKDKFTAMNNEARASQNRYWHDAWKILRGIPSGISSLAVDFTDSLDEVENADNEVYWCGQVGELGGMIVSYGGAAKIAAKAPGVGFLRRQQVRAGITRQQSRIAALEAEVKSLKTAAESASKNLKRTQKKLQKKPNSSALQQQEVARQVKLTEAEGALKTAEIKLKAANYEMIRMQERITALNKEAGITPQQRIDREQAKIDKKQQKLDKKAEGGGYSTATTRRRQEQDAATSAAEAQRQAVIDDAAERLGRTADEIDRLKAQQTPGVSSGSPSAVRTDVIDAEYTVIPNGSTTGPTKALPNPNNTN